MDESKTAITERLRREGRWEEASKFRDEARAELRCSGLKRTEAAEKAWEVMAEKYPPRAQPAPSDDHTTNGVAESMPPPADCQVDPEGQIQANLVRDTIWVYDHLDVPGPGAGPAPSRGAWSLLAWARANRDRFFEQMFPKAMAQAKHFDSEKKRVLLDDPRKLEWLDQYLAKVLPGARAPVTCPACCAVLDVGESGELSLARDNSLEAVGRTS